MVWVHIRIVSKRRFKMSGNTIGLGTEIKNTTILNINTICCVPFNHNELDLCEFSMRHRNLIRSPSARKREQHGFLLHYSWVIGSMCIFVHLHKFSSGQSHRRAHPNSCSFAWQQFCIFEAKTFTALQKLPGITHEFSPLILIENLLSLLQRYIGRGPDKVHIFISIIPISSPN